MHMFYIQQSFYVNPFVCEIVWENIVCQTGHRWQYNTAHAFCLLDIRLQTLKYVIISALRRQQ